MKILLISHYFAPEIGAPQTRFRNFIRRWTDAGDQVQVLTGFPNHPQGVIHDGYRDRRTMKEERGGAHIVRTWVYATESPGLVPKTLSHVSLMISGVVLGWRLVERPDVVLVSSPTFFSIFTAWVYARRFRVPLVVEVRDLWPGIFVELGTLKNRWLIAALEFLELKAYRSADRVVVVTEGFKDDLLARGVPEAKVDTITNGVDPQRFSPQPASCELRRSLGAEEGDLLVVYIGNHGISQALDSVVDAAALVCTPVHVALVGHGASKAALVDRLDLPTNLSFHDAVHPDAVPAYLWAADVLLVPLRAIPGFDVFLPSKMFEFLAAGTPVVGSVSGEAAAILVAAGNTVVEPESSGQLAAAIDRLADPELRIQQADAGRRFVNEHFNVDTLSKRYRRLLGEVIGSGRTSVPRGARGLRARILARVRP